MNRTEIYLNEISYKISFFTSAIITPIGIVCCFITSLVYFLNAKLKKTIGSYLLGCISSFSMISLLIEYLFIGFLPNFPGTNYVLENWSDALCVLVQYVTRIFPQMASASQAYLSVDRFIQIKYPNKFKHSTRIWFMNLILVLIFISLTILNGITFVYRIQFDLEEEEVEVEEMNSTSINETMGHCEPSNGYMNMANDLIGALLRLFLPFTIINVFNAKMIRFLVEHKRKISTFGYTSDQHQRKEKELAQTLITYDIIFLAHNLPLATLQIIHAIWDNSDLDFVHNQVSPVAARWRVAYRLSLFVAYLYNSMTFLVNMSFNKIFRQEILRILRMMNESSTSGASRQHH